MSIRRQMLKAASRAEISLGNRAESVVRFITGRVSEDGGFKDRAGKSDLYYTVFGIEALLALGVDIPREKFTSYLAQFEHAQSLDFIHLACLVRCWADLTCPVQPGIRNTIAQRIGNRLAEHDTIYTCFLALCAYQDLGVQISGNKTFVDCVRSHRTVDGGYANEFGFKVGATPSTAAAVTILHHLNEPVPKQAIDRLFSCIGPNGGFRVMPQVGDADLLSTATALHALSEADVPMLDIRQQCLDFVDGLWEPDGGFCASSTDRTADCEYTYYALLAMGHLSQ